LARRNAEKMGQIKGQREKKKAENDCGLREDRRA
jgi:hypothetical protein